ncbi:MAG TPA: tripartite tricarboxylate transporter substrate-binding protein, partial [Burkholderiales bacterium]|nr:tripartite tricarboxylate transporter substrate-binding protein [Burkholderiales bacterium]
MKAALCILFALLASMAVAQPYPTRPVRVVVPLSPGGFADTPARLLAPKLSEQFGKQFYIENRPGAGGTIGWGFVAQSAPDGYTLAITGSTLLVGAHLYKNVP